MRERERLIQHDKQKNISHSLSTITLCSIISAESGGGVIGCHGTPHFKISL